MLTPLLLLACAPEPKPDTGTAPELEPTTQCQPIDLEPDTLDWSDPGPGGVSAEDVFGFAVGPHTATLSWDDGTTAEATFTATPTSAIQQRTGESVECPVEITGLADWTLSTGDGRLTLSGSSSWYVADAALPAGGALISEALSDTELTLPRLNSGSARRLRLFLGDDGVLVSVQIEEAWPLGTDTNRVCVRGALDPAAIDCHDTVEGQAPD